MDVESALLRKIDNFLRQDVAVGHDDPYVRLEGFQFLRQLRVARILGLEERNLFGLRDLLDRRGNRARRAAGWKI